MGESRDPKEAPTLYDVLEVPANAAFRDIQKAYSEMLSIYDADALSTYSLFTRSQREEILDRARAAFQTLMDPQKRGKYDQSLVNAGRLAPENRFEQKAKTPMPVFRTTARALSGQVEKKVKKRMNKGDIKALKDELHAKPTVSGADLRHLRRAANVSLSEIFEVSRVSVTILDAIENDHRDVLPSMIHLKGFLKSYAEFLGLDADRLIPAYLAHFEEISS